MKKSSHFITILISVLLTALLTVFLFLTFAKSFDTALGYFSDKTIFPTLVRAISVVSVVAIFALGFFCPQKDMSKISVSAWHKVFCMLSAINAAASAVLTAILTDLVPLSLVSMLGILAFCAFAVCSVFYGTGFNGSRFALLSISVIHPVLTAYMHYTDFSKPINSSLNVMYSCFSIAFLIFVVCELKIMLGRSSRFAFASKLLCGLAGIASSVSYIAAFVLNKVTDKEFIPLFVFALSVSLYCFSSACLYLKKENEITEETAEEDTKTETEESTENEA